MTEAVINPSTGNLDIIGLSANDLTTLDARYLKLNGSNANSDVDITISSSDYDLRAAEIKARSTGLVCQNTTGSVAISAVQFPGGIGGSKYFYVYSGSSVQQIGMSLSNVIMFNAYSTKFTVNEGKADVDFIVSGDNETNLLFADAGNDRIGIGESAPGARLHVQGAVSGVTSIFRANATTPGNLTEWQGSGGTALTVVNSSGYLGIGNSALFSSQINVGVGDSGAASRSSITINNGGYAAPSAVNSTSNGDKFVFWNASNWKNAIGNASGEFWFQSSGLSSACITFYTLASTGAPSERMRIDASGNIGMGTTTPASYLYASNGLFVAGATDAQIGIITATNQRGRLAFADGTSGTQRYMGFINYDHATNAMEFGTNATTYAYINSSGNVGIGISPLYRLHVSQTSSVSILGNAFFELEAGYTGSASTTFSIQGWNKACGTNQTYATDATFGWYPYFNRGLSSYTTGSTVGGNVGGLYIATNGNINYGIFASSTVAKNSGTNIGVMGSGKNTGSGAKQIGGFFCLYDSVPTYESAALIADNAAQAVPIFLGRDNGTTVFSIIDGGNVGIGTTAPGAKLAIGDGTPASPRMRFDVGSGTTGVEYYMGGAFKGASLFTVSATAADNNWVLYTGAAGAAPKMTLTGSGHLMVNTTTDRGLLALGIDASNPENLSIGQYNYLGGIYSSGGSVWGYNAKAFVGTTDKVVVANTNAVIGYDYIRMGYDVGIAFHTLYGSVTAGDTASSERMRIAPSTGYVGIGITAPATLIHADQSSTTAALPVATLDQADIDEPFFKLIGTCTDGAVTGSIVEAADVGSATLAGYVKVEVQDDGDVLADQDYYMPVYTLS